MIPFIDSEYGRIGNVILADLDLPRYMSQIRTKRIELLLVPAYDWEEITPYHSNMAAFAAIQYGASLVRANGKGIVAVYDYKGNALARKNTFTADSKIVYAEIPIQSTTTVYSIIGDAFVFFWIIFLLIVVGLKIAKNIGHSTN
jgi:apolipoprotein N-acyltransferase